ncbi:MAG: hypothetical protein AB1791_09020 [Chloroflexota bacterium]
MSNRKKGFLVLFAVLLCFSVVLFGCSQQPTTVEVTRIVEKEVPVVEEVEVTRIVESVVEVTPVPVVAVVPFQDDWANSPHADKTALAFNDWNEEDPPEVPDRCAKCHSTPGYLDFIGADGSAAGVVDAPAPIGTVIECQACHNPTTMALTNVTFPSGAEITSLGREARCMVCHQGRNSTVSVDNSITEAGLTDEDTVSEDLGFSNIHYYAAAATMYGTLAKGGYEYEGKSYDAKFDHVAGMDSCIDCHNPHTLQLKLDKCAECHEGVASYDDVKNIRMAGSAVDYDGDGDLEEGIYYEIEGLRTTLYQALQAYANEVSGTPIAYNGEHHPYFFIDVNADGQSDESEAIGDNRYNAWTARLAKAAYNYQVSVKDPGAHAHGGKYVIELLYDSIESLNAKLATPVDLSLAHRIDQGHFAGSEIAFREFDARGGVVAGTCSKCHTAVGLPLFIRDGVAITQPAGNGLNCSTCHNDVSTFTRYEVADVTFPNGARLTLDNPDSNLCLLCHQGRESTVSVNRLIGNLGDDEQSESLRFLNIHYFAAGASLLGAEAKGAYEYTGQTYNGRNDDHPEKFNTCIECHSTHGLEVEVAECADCHENVATREDLRNIRTSEVDFDGDGDVTEGIAGEVATMRELLYPAIQLYAAETVGTPIAYSAEGYPYWFTDTNGDGTADETEAVRENGYSTWTPRLLRAAYNYQYVTKDPGVYAHNGQYILQVLYDTLTDMGVDTSAMTRPAVGGGE